MPTWKTGFLTGVEPTLPTVNVKDRDGGAPNQVSRPLEPSSRVSATMDSCPLPDAFGSAFTGCPATWNTASA